MSDILSRLPDGTIISTPGERIVFVTPVPDPVGTIEENLTDLETEFVTLTSTLQTHIDLTNAHGATTAATGGTIALRDSGGRIQAAAPVASGDVALLFNITTTGIVNEVNIAKLDFKIDTHLNASKNALKQLVVDCLNDSTGINAGASSGYTYDSADKSVKLDTSGGIDSYAKIMLHMDGTDDGTTFTDEAGNTVTPTNAVTKTATKKFGTASGYFNGTAKLSIPDSDNWDVGSADFSVDFWIKVGSSPTNTGLCGQWVDNNNYAGCLFIGNTLGFNSVIGGTDHVCFVTSGAVTLNTDWHHLAFVRNGANFYIFVDGVAQSLGVPKTTANTNLAAPYTIGDKLVSVYADFTGYIDEFRFSKGIARWTSGFTPPAAPYSAPATQAVVIWNSDSATDVPTSAYMVADSTVGTGTITYWFSRDGGTTWSQCTLETLTSISGQPSGQTIVAKAILTGNAVLSALAWGWK